MTLKELQNQALQLPISDRWLLVQSVLNSIQQETLRSGSTSQTMKPLTDPVPPFLRGVRGDLAPWTQSLVGVIQLDGENTTESYVDYLEEKYG